MQAEATRALIKELTAQLEEFAQVAEEVRITRKTLPALPDPALPTPPPVKLPDHPAHQQIMAVFAAADAPLRARAVGEAMDLEIAPSNVNNVRLKLGTGIRAAAACQAFSAWAARPAVSWLPIMGGYGPAGPPPPRKFPVGPA
ncbi:MULTISPECIES: hypothetical protein [unclassified Streptomyces]|uniref:hypothetical protein n=1 Tax=unclassified Streptomyces TaxID=2593676 RepID=UPI0003709495|nr:MULTISPECIES: hypothetical protein [unclassified Streptomyces]